LVTSISTYLSAFLGSQKERKAEDDFKSKYENFKTDIEKVMERGDV